MLRRLLPLALALAACGPGESLPEAPAAEGGGIAVLDPFLPAPPADVAAVYLRVVDRGGRGDRLLGASSPSAASAMLHRTVMEGDAVRMGPAPDGIAVPPGGEIRLAPGADHVMLMGLASPLAAGDRLELELVFERAGRLRVRVPVIPLESALEHAR